MFDAAREFAEVLGGDDSAVVSRIDGDLLGRDIQREDVPCPLRRVPECGEFERVEGLGAGVFVPLQGCLDPPFGVRRTRRQAPGGGVEVAGTGVLDLRLTQEASGRVEFLNPRRRGI